MTNDVTNVNSFNSDQSMGKTYEQVRCPTNNCKTVGKGMHMLQLML